jgi:ABC-type sulfate transport system permease component
VSDGPDPFSALIVRSVGEFGSVIRAAGIQAEAG